MGEQIRFVDIALIAEVAAVGFIAGVTVHVVYRSSFIVVICKQGIVVGGRKCRIYLLNKIKYKKKECQITQIFTLITVYSFS